MKRYLLFILLMIPTLVMADTRVIDGNQFDVYKRGKDEIINKWNTYGYIDIEMDKFQTNPSYVSPYRAGVLNSNYIEAITNNLNYYRYLVGVPGTTRVTGNNEQLQTAEVIQTLNVEAGNELTHELNKDFNRPNDMSVEFYNLGANALHTHVGYQAPNIYYPNEIFFHESAFDSTSGHRTALLSPELSYVDYGIGEKVVYSKVTTDVSQYNEMVNDFAAYPSPGYFPKQDFAMESDWDIYLNINKFKYLTDEELNNIVIKIEDSNEEYTEYRRVADGNLMVDKFNGEYFRIIFAQPVVTTTYYEGDYTITVDGLKDKSGNVVQLRYTVNFFDKYEGMDAIINDLAFDLNLLAVDMDGEYREAFVKKALNELGIQVYLDSGAVIYQNVKRFNIQNVDTNHYRAFAGLDLPNYALDPYNIISNYAYVNVYTNPSNYHFSYNDTSYTSRVLDNVTLSLKSFTPKTYPTASGDAIANLFWFKEGENDLELLDENNAKYSFENGSVTIHDVKLADSGTYYAGVLLMVPYTYYNQLVYQTELYYSKALTLDVSGYLGDMNQNGNIDIQDIIILLKTYLGINDVTDEVLSLGDMNNDDTIGLADVISLLRVYLEI